MTSRVIVYYVLMWFFLLLLGGTQEAAGIPSEFGLPQWGPGLAGLVMLLLFKKDGHKITWFSKRTPLKHYILAVLVPTGIGLVVFVIQSILKIPVTKDTGFGSSSLLLIVLWAPIGALGEEIGWRGYLHKRLDTKMRGLVSSLLVGLLWMPMHIHFFSQGPLLILLLLLLIISYSVVLYALVQDANFNVLAATLFHLSINYTNLLYFDKLFETSFMAIIAGIWLVSAAISVLRNKEIYLTPKQDAI